MSSAPKRLHEEGSHSTPQKKRPLEENGIFSSFSGKLIQQVGSDYHLPYEPGHDGRLTKVQRMETRDIDKRQFLLNRVPSSLNSGSDHSVSSQKRPELRNPKESRDANTENRETKGEVMRDFYVGARMDSQVHKTQNDLRSDTAGEVDNHTAANYLNWKEGKELQRVKRYFETTSDGLDSRLVARHGLQNTVEVTKDLSRTEEHDSSKVHEATGENKVDLKGEEKFKEKDRKRLEEKHRDFGERSLDKNDFRNMQSGEADSDRKELLREEQETDRGERERKDAPRDKEYKDKEKDSVKRESPNANERENRHSEKDMMDGSVRISEQEITRLESKKLKDDSWKASDRDHSDKKRESDIDAGDRHEQHGKCCEKELDDGAEGDGVERDKEASICGVHQRKRMMRSRGTPQTPQREIRFRSKSRDNEGSQGKPEISTVVYKPGQCNQELLKSWKEFVACQDSKNDGTCQTYPTLEIRVPAEHVTLKNCQVKDAQLWGTDIYTNDSDIVGVLMHTGYCRPASAPPPSAIHELKATVQVLPPQDCYSSSVRNNVRSRAWGAGSGCSFRVERCCIVKKGGGTIDIKPRRSYISALEPTIAPVSSERTMTTRSAASNALRQQRYVQEVSVQYNLCNEPWLRYKISIVADKGLKKPLCTSARLKKGEVLYLETQFERYELCFSGEKVVCNGTTSASTQAPESGQDKRQNHSSHARNGERHLTDRENMIDVFRWSRCKKPLPQEVMLSVGIPLRVEDLEILEENLEWEDVEWSQFGVWVAGKEYTIARVHFLGPKKK